MSLKLSAPCDKHELQCKWAWLSILSIERPSVLELTAPERQSDHCAPRISPQPGEAWPFFPLTLQGSHPPAMQVAWKASKFQCSAPTPKKPRNKENKHFFIALRIQDLNVSQAPTNPGIAESQIFKLLQRS